MEVQIMEEIFQDKMDKEIKIEPKDWMPEKYRKTLDQANQPTCAQRNCRYVA